jgi:hypothetical protein
VNDVLAAAAQTPAVKARARAWVIIMRQAGIAVEADGDREAAALINEAYQRARVAQANAMARDPGFAIMNPVGYLIQYLVWVGQDALKLRTVVTTDPADPAGPLVDDRAAARPGGRYRQQAHAGPVTHWHSAASSAAGADPFEEAERRHRMLQARRILLDRRGEIWEQATRWLGQQGRAEGIWTAAARATDWLLIGDGALSVTETLEQEMGRSGDWWSGAGVQAEALAKRIRRDRPWACYVVWEAVRAVSDPEDVRDRMLLRAVTSVLRDEAERRAKAPNCPGPVVERLTALRAELARLLSELE